MPSMTPIRIRGKRSATKEEKWHYGKHRKPHLMKSRTPSERSSSSQPSSSSVKSAMKQRQREQNPDISKLEQLPTEVLQAIFEYSENVNLPLVSPTLASQLASQHLHHQLTSSILDSVLGQAAGTSSDLANATRLMNSRFFSWQFFKGWLRHEFERLQLEEEYRNAIGPDGETSAQSERQEEWTWYRLRPNGNLLPPKKLLRGPFHSDKIHFLRFMTSTFRGDPDHVDPLYSELAREGLEQAVAEGAGDTLASFWTLGMLPDTELLRQAVTDAGCDKDVVRRLVTRVLHLTSEPVDINFLDPALWAWADKAHRNGNKKGQWLMELLRESARDSGSTETEVESTKEAITS